MDSRFEKDAVRHGREARRQEREVTGHIASIVRKQREMKAAGYSYFRFLQYFMCTGVFA